MLFPQVDIAVSRWFADADGRFPLAAHPGLQTLRLFNDGIMIAGLAAAAALLVRAMWRPMPVRPRDALLPLLTYALGPGLLVNLLLKEVVGRARPRDIVEFGGDHLFTTVWEISSACRSNCSFTSGEAASAMAMLSLLALVPVGLPRLRRGLAVVLWLAAGLFAANRVVFGAHFLSDTLLSMLLVVLVMRILRRVLDGRTGERFDRLFQHASAAGRHQ